MTIQSEIQSLSPSALIELFVLDSTMIEGGVITRFHSGTNQTLAPITWQGEEYMPLPIESEGFDLDGQGNLPRPKVRVANVQGLFSSIVADTDDLIGCRVTRKRTFARYLDAINFPDGNPDADPDQYLPDELWFIDRKTSEDRYFIEWELASAFDLEGVKIPLRQVIQNYCPWLYRGSDCGYDGEFIDKDGNPTGDGTKDFCTKTLSACKARFGKAKSMPFGGFPGVVRNV
jgi:lambda family phage minor tail protein L